MTISNLDSNPIIKETFSWNKQNIAATVIAITSLALPIIMAMSTFGFITIAIPLLAKITIGLVGISLFSIATLSLLNEETEANELPNLLNSSEFPNHDNQSDTDDTVQRQSNINSADSHSDDTSVQRRYSQDNSSDSDDTTFRRRPIEHIQNTQKSAQINHITDERIININNYLHDALFILQTHQKINQEDLETWKGFKNSIEKTTNKEVIEDTFSALTYLESIFQTNTAHLALNTLRGQYELGKIPTKEPGQITLERQKLKKEPTTDENGTF